MRKLSKMLVAFSLMIMLGACAQEKDATSKAAYQAGSYTASVAGHNADVTVEVTFSEEAIVEVKVFG